jgi:ribosomal protein S18 acetylase RimI-like enzyme
MSDNLSFTIRPMQLSDLSQAMTLASFEGWNQTVKDWRLLLDNPINACLVAEYNKKVIGTATAINYSNLAGWIGMVLVDKEFRSKGIGRMLVTNIIDKLHGFKSVKLDATPAGQPLYQKLGFIEERVLYRMICPSIKSFTKRKNDLTPEPIKPEDFEDIIEFDRHVFGLERKYLIKTILQNYPHKGLLLKRNSKITGFILGRDGIRYNYLGPVFAQSTADAITLISMALESLSKKDIALDVHNDKTEMISWLESIGFNRQRQFARMYLNKNPFRGKVENQYLIIGPEFG